MISVSLGNINKLPLADSKSHKPKLYLMLSGFCIPEQVELFGGRDSKEKGFSIDYWKANRCFLRGDGKGRESMTRRRTIWKETWRLPTRDVWGPRGAAGTKDRRVCGLE